MINTGIFAGIPNGDTETSTTSCGKAASENE